MAEQANFKRINFFEGFITTDEDWNAAEAYHVERGACTTACCTRRASFQWKAAA